MGVVLEMFDIDSHKLEGMELYKFVAQVVAAIVLLPVESIIVFETLFESDTTSVCYLLIITCRSQSDIQSQS